MIRKLFKSNSGMTLIEIMVVVAIIAGITGLVAVSVIGRKKEADIKLTKTQISNVLSGLDQYRLDNHRYPSTDQGLDALAKKPSSGVVPKNYPDGGYMRKVPRDAWGQDFNYASPGTHGNDVEVWSSGPDGEADTGDDIQSWELEGEGEE